LVSGGSDFSLIHKPRLFLPEPTDKVVADLDMALVVQAMIPALDDHDAGIGHYRRQLVGTGDEHSRILAAEHGHDRDACGRKRCVGVIAARHREVPESREQRPAETAIGHLLAEIALQAIAGL
jgi:hypothetical protein